MQPGAIWTGAGSTASEVRAGEHGQQDEDDEDVDAGCQGQVPTPPQLQLLLANVKSSEAAAKLPRP
jgi:hypothetical protein